MFYYYIVILVFGLVFGSFLTSLSYRIVRGEPLPKGRSYCPTCKKQIAWYDNIPLLSYLILGGKCRNCGKHISSRYPLIEFSTALTFLLVFYYHQSTVLNLAGFPSQIWTLPFLLLVSFLLIAIFVTDMEYQLIPDELSFMLFTVVFVAVTLSGTDHFYAHILSGFSAALFLLILHLATLGRGMGLGDVKLALGIGMLLGWPYAVTWLFVSFILGAGIGIVLLAFGKAKFGKHIAFGPFLILAFFVVLLSGDKITSVLMPYL